MNTQAIAQHLNINEELIIEVQMWARVLWVRIKGMRPKFVSKKVAIIMNMIQVVTSKEKVVVDQQNNVAYAVRAGYDVGDFYHIKRFDPIGKDLRMIDLSSVKGEMLSDSPLNPVRSAEYKAVLSAISYRKPSLIAYGEPGKCRYPSGYKIAKDY